MKTLRLSLLLFSGFTLYGHSMLSFEYGVSYPDGIFSGLEYNSEYWDTYFEVNNIYDVPEINRFYFISKYINFGSVSYNGTLRDLNRENLHYFSYKYPSEVIINKKGNPLNNIGVIFKIPRIQSGCSIFKKNSYSQLLFWKNLDLNKAGFISISQSLTLPGNQTDPEAWYLTEYPRRSLFQLNSIGSVILGTEKLFGGGQLHLNSSPEDASGFSILFLVGASLRGVYIQNELRINSGEFFTSDLNPALHTFLIKGKLDFPELPVSLCNSYHFFLKRETLPWENRLWEFNFKSKADFDHFLWFYKGQVDVSILNSEIDSLLKTVNISGSVKRKFDCLYVGFSGEAEYNSIYSYVFSLTGGYKSSLLGIGLASSVEINRSITLALSLKGTLFLKNVKLIGNFDLEDISIYNCGRIKMKPYFFVGLELIDLLSLEKDQL